MHPVGCGDDRHNCLPIIEGWNYIVRLYRPHPEVAARHPGQLVVVACHAGVIESSLLLARLPVVGDMTGARMKLRTQHASLTTWEVDAGQWKLVDYNDGAHHLGVNGVGYGTGPTTASGNSWMSMGSGAGSELA